MSNQFNADTIEQIRRILTIFNTSEAEIRPHFFLTGGSGTGKTHAIETLCEELEITMFDVNAAQLTKEGTSGNSLSKALTPLKGNDGRPVVCFVDEFDKLFVSGNTNSELAHEVTNGVQNEFLKVLESRTASVYGDYGHYLDVQVSNVLFIFAGAFNGEEDLDLDRLREFGIKTEFLGRVGLTYPMKQLTLEQLGDILDRHPLLHKYLALFTDVKHEDVWTEVMAAIEDNYQKNTLGARLITTLLHQYFIDGGLSKPEVKKTSFQKTLKLNKDAA
jgi:ATP-dependent protease Clp ATPase subunit